MLYRIAVPGIIAVLALASGCATVGGPTAEEQVDGVIAAWQAALKAAELDTVLALYSEDYSSSQTPDKAALRRSLENAREFLPELETDLSQAQTTVNGGSATVGPVRMNARGRDFSMQITLAEEQDGWKIINTETGN